MRRKAGSTKKNRARRVDARKGEKQPAISVDQLLASAESIMSSSMDVEQAMTMYSQAATLLRAGKGGSSIVTREIDLIQVLEKLGECKVSMGDQEGAKKDFREALSLLEKNNQGDKDTMAYHESRSSLCLYIGQLCMEHEALETYQKGVQSLESCMALAPVVDEESMEGGEATPKRAAIFRQKLSGAYCTISELYLTDLCYDDNAETECEAHLEKALQLKDDDGEPLVDALQTMASLRLSQKSRQMEAIPFIWRAYEKMRVGSDALASLVGLGEDQDDDTEDGEAKELKEVDAANNLPEFEFRCQTAKLLLDCVALFKESASTNDSKEDQCLKAAISVLGSLLAQNDEVVEIWFLTGCAFTSKRPPLVEPAQFYFERAMEMLLDIKKALDQEVRFADQEEAAEIQEQMEENQIQIEDVQAKLDEIASHDISTMEE